MNFNNIIQNYWVHLENKSPPPRYVSKVGNLDFLTLKKAVDNIDNQYIIDFTVSFTKSLLEEREQKEFYAGYSIGYGSKYCTPIKAHQDYLTQKEDDQRKNT